MNERLFGQGLIQLLFGRFFLKHLMLCGGGGTFGMGSSYSHGTQNSSSANYPTWAKSLYEAFVQPGQDTLSSYQSNGGVLRSQAGDALGNIMSPSYLSDTNPITTQIEEASRAQGLEGFQTAWNQIQGQGQKLGGLGSSATQTVGAEAARRLGSDLAGQSAQMRYQDYANRQRSQQNAIPQASTFGYQPLTYAESIANLLRGLETSGWGNTQGMTRSDGGSLAGGYGTYSGGPSGSQVSGG